MADPVTILHPATGRPINVSAAQRARLYPDAELADQPTEDPKPKRSTRKTKKGTD